MKKLLLTAFALILAAQVHAQTLTNFGEVTEDGRMLFGQDYVGAHIDIVDMVKIAQENGFYQIKLMVKDTNINYPEAESFLGIVNYGAERSDDPAQLTGNMVIFNTSHLTQDLSGGTATGGHEYCGGQRYDLKRPIDMSVETIPKPGWGKSFKMPKVAKDPYDLRCDPESNMADGDGNCIPVFIDNRNDNKPYVPSNIPCTGSTIGFTDHEGESLITITIVVPESQADAVINFANDLNDAGVFPVISQDGEQIASREDELEVLTGITELPDEIMFSK